MNLNASIVDQQVRALVDRHRARFESDFRRLAKQDAALTSAAFVLLIVRIVLDLTEDEAFEALVEGEQDFGIDAIHVSPVQDGEFTVTLFQGKYSQKLDKDPNFPENGVTKVLQAVRTLFDPAKEISLNARLLERIEEVRSLISDGLIPQVRVVLANNGRRWTAGADRLIEQAALGSQVRFEHVNHDGIVAVLQAAKPVDATLRLEGRAFVEEFDFRRVLVGRVGVAQLAELFRQYGDRLLERNVRRYLGRHGNRVNEGIARTLQDPGDQANFYFYNNGITIVCSQFQHNALQAESWSVKLSGMQVINGGQTCRTIEDVLSQPSLFPATASVLLRIYELPRGEEDFVRKVTYATNSQNPVDLRDLRSGDEIQRKLELSIQQLGFSYRRQRSDSPMSANEITTAAAAEAVLSIWRRSPQQARFMAGEHFGKLYDVIFTPDLNGAQVVTAVLLLRIAENKRKRPSPDARDFVRYGSYFIAMLMGEFLLGDLQLPLAALDHTTFEASRERIGSFGESYFTRAVERLENALRELYGDRRDDLTLQRLSATFRRGDLMRYLRPAQPEAFGSASPEA